MRVAACLFLAMWLAGCESPQLGGPVTWSDCQAVERGQWRGFSTDEACAKRALARRYD